MCFMWIETSTRLVKRCRFLIFDDFHSANKIINFSHKILYSDSVVVDSRWLTIIILDASRRLFGCVTRWTAVHGAEPRKKLQNCLFHYIYKSSSYFYFVTSRIRLKKNVLCYN